MTPADREIEECLEAGRSFLLDAGAGAGKTYSLVRALNWIIANREPVLRKKGQKVACITFTNVAADEVKERIQGSPLVAVSTIHEFIWDLIRSFQPDLKHAVKLYNEQLPTKSRRKVETDELEQALTEVPVTYSDRGTKLLAGRLHHDDLLGVARVLFFERPMASEIARSRFPFILVDEYQDTSEEVIAILLDRLVVDSGQPIQVGLFGDRLQSIYAAGIGELSPERQAKLKLIVKPENRRSAPVIVDVLNKIRDDFEQTAVRADPPGEACFLQVAGEVGDPLGVASSFLEETLGWDLSGEDVRTLLLTHKLIGARTGYEQILSAYQARGAFYRDQAVRGEEAVIAFFLEKIDPLLASWREGLHGRCISHMESLGGQLVATGRVTEAREALERLSAAARDGTTGDLLRILLQGDLFPVPDFLRQRLEGDETPLDSLDEAERAREERERTFYGELLGLPYTQVEAFVSYLQDNTPFATKHGVKGAEFSTVLVVLDDQGANWNQYSFSKYLTDEDLKKTPKRWARTRNLFYVSCSRARERLAVVDLSPASDSKLARARELFGDERVYLLGPMPMS